MTATGYVPQDLEEILQVSIISGRMCCIILHMYIWGVLKAGALPPTFDITGVCIYVCVCVCVCIGCVKGLVY